MPSIQIPESLCTSLHPNYEGPDSSSEVIRVIRLAAKKMIEGAIRDGLPPATLPPPADGGITQTISFSAKEDRAIRTLSKEAGIPESQAAKRYLYASIARGDALRFHHSSGEDMLEPYRLAVGKKARPAQSVFAKHLVDSLQNTKIGLVEGATGIGKTFAMVSVACSKLQSVGAGRVTITVPSIQLMCQFVGQHRELEQRLADIPAARPVLGRQEFVCCERLRQVLGEGIVNADPLPIMDWINSNGRATGQVAELFGHRWLVASLLHISPTFPVEEVHLRATTEKNDPGALAYALQFAQNEEDAPATEVIYCTHAMISVDIRRRLTQAREIRGKDGDKELQKEISATRDQRNHAKDEDTRKQLGKKIADLVHASAAGLADLAKEHDIGHLPPWQYLLVDEAHLFEANLASALSSYISVMSYLADLRELSAKGILSAAAVSRASAAEKLLRESAPDENQDLELSDGGNGLAGRARAAIAELADALLSSRTKTKGTSAKSPLLERCIQTATELRRGIEMDAAVKGNRTVVSFSPVRHYPQIIMGRKSIERELRFLWNTTTGAACVSATLYLRRLDVDTAALFRAILAIPQNREQEYPPIRPAWVTKPVDGLWLPENRQVDGRIWLRPPTRADKLSEKKLDKTLAQWLDEVAAEVLRIHQGGEGLAPAAGGVLVLMTGYDAAKGLAQRLGDAIIHKIVASKDHSLAEQRSRFITAAQAGHKPVWIAVGAAWTGLDVNGAEVGIPADRDNILTDLVIPRIPFALNRTMTHYHRASSTEVPWELLDTAMRFKQGIGRLIRREGLPHNRRIFVLDGRLNDPRFEGYLSMIQRIIGIYPVKRLAPAA